METINLKQQDIKTKQLDEWEVLCIKGTKSNLPSESDLDFLKSQIKAVQTTIDGLKRIWKL